MNEHEEQCAVIDYCDLKNILIFAIPNGSYKSKTAAGKFKDEGLRSGVPDLFIPVSKFVFKENTIEVIHGLFIEMKSKKGRLSDSQKEWIEKLSKEGYQAVCCHGADEAIKVINEYFELNY
ncbi:MAG: hypothetical protein A2287_04735 [Candidatus Melainabacteria bacterium RIFOXYA12_FULL_32_12]|nr:MAG: hypothetical protein A2287_04735 [Candidatus Melainabacteria bacterium RIFOXYA12_FULL_32_12]